MPDDLKLVISGDAASLIAALRASGVNLDQFGDNAEKAGKKSKGFGSEVKGLARELGAGLALGAVVKGLGDFAIGAIKAADESRVAKTGFVGLSGSAEAAAENLAAISRATTVAGKQLVDETSRIQIANQLLGMGIANTSDELEKTIYVSRRLGGAFRGLGAKEAADEFALMMSNMSVARLDAFGISSGAVRARIEELMTSTKGVSREQAFFQATMEEAENTLSRLGPEVATNQQAAEAAAATWRDFQGAIGELGQALLTILAPAMETAMGLVERMTEGAAAWQRILGLSGSSLEEIAEQTGQFTTEAARAATGIDDMAAAEAAAAEEAKRHADMIRSLGMIQASYYQDIQTAESDLLQATIDYNHQRVEAMNEASRTIRDNEVDRADALIDLQRQVEDERNQAIQQGNVSGAQNLNYRLEQIQKHYEEEKAKLNGHYDEMNADVKAKEAEQLQTLRDAWAEQQREFEKHIGELKLKTTLGMLESTGQLKELTGGVTDSANEAFDLIRAGIIPLNDDLARAIAEQNTKLTGSFDDVKATAESTRSKLSNIFGSIFSDVSRAQSGIQSIGGGRIAVPGFAGGGDFVVPPGFPNDSFMMGVTSGERVTVTNNHFNLNTTTSLPSNSVTQDFASMQAMAQ